MDIRRPPYLRSQSENSSTATIIPSSYPHLRALDDFDHSRRGANTLVSPRRPPRNPARTLASTKSGFEHVSIARTQTGTKEEVTPWELEPFPATFSEAPPTLITPTASSKRASIRPSSAGGHGHGPGLSFSDFYLLRRKSTGSPKSSAKAKAKAKSPPTTNGHGTSNNTLLQKRGTPGSGLPTPSSSHNSSSHNSSSPNLTTNSNASPRLTHKITSAKSSHPNPRNPPLTSGTTGHSHTTTPPVSSSSRPSRQSTSSGIVAPQPFLAKPSSHTASTSGSAAAPAPGIQKSHSKPNSNFSSKSSLEQHIDHQTANNLKFSTADRTILEELKRNISAREAQFIVKGPLANNSGSDNGYRGGGLGHDMGGLGVSGGRKHHPFKKEDVPYPRSYDREVLDLDVWETLFYHQICESLTWHVFENPPTKVLDIGCGTGSWILDCARIWRTCHFVGMDLVPIQPDLQQVGSSDLAHRVTWIQGNFLESLPFPNEEFDFVHIKRISLGVPEDKWDYLFEEILRVMKPGAAFEMIEEDLMFPGGAIRVDDENESIPENFNSHPVESTLFSDSDARQHSSASSISSFYFASGPEIRNRNRPRSSSSTDSSSTATDIANSHIVEKTFRRRSVPVKGSDQRRNTTLDYATLTSLMGLGDGENNLVISEREDENHYQELDRKRYSGSDWDSLLASTSSSPRNSSVEEQDRTTHDLLAVPSPANQAAGGTSPSRCSPLPLPSPSSSAPALPSFLASPTTAFMSMPSVIPNTMGRGLEAEAIVEDEEGEKNATWASVNDDTANGQLDTSAESHMPSHFQEPTDSTIMPVKPQLSEIHTPSIPASSKSTPLRHPLSVSTGSLTDLQLSSPYSPNPYAKLNYVTSSNSPSSPKRPLSTSNNGFGTSSSIHLPSMSFSQSMHSLSSSSPHSLNAAVDADKESRIISSTSTAAPFLLRTLPKPPVNPRDHSMLEMIYNEMNAARFVNLSPLSLLPNLLGLYFKDLRTHPPVIFTFPPIPVVEQSRSSDPDPDPDEDAQDAIRPSPLSAGTVHTARGRSMSNASNVSSRLTGSPTPSSARTAYFEGLPDHWINMRQIVKRESPYVIYDGSRLSALSPSTRASILSSSIKQPASSSLASSIASARTGSMKEEDSAAADADRSYSEIDPPRGTHDMFSPRPHNPAHDEPKSTPRFESDRDLGMFRDNEKKTRARSPSIGPVRPPSRDQPSEPESNEARLKTALTELTRETYEDMLRRFYLDMQDCMALPAVLQERFGWTTFPASPSAERGTFETECEKYQQWEAEQHQRNNFKFLSGEVPRQRADQPILPPSNSIFNSSATADSLPASPMNGRSNVSSVLAKTQQGSRSLPPIASSVAPSRRLSRSLRIFVAWKGVEAS
ncbi:uncharacterized protein C8R40DRAFT_1168134 [Lentinula edodes]|uniref:uncharacterized protein n=1 Tax=Lentinula edodes TaxID=5353 RepID=UPI001E8DC4D2|nr:uncharacterized protein C8R40DRAFT_1168134 [Lentinula edodes]KAH7878089.1 hypothetical protein C8R40DRAFT_1168134 [Lentinula edodes]